MLLDVEGRPGSDNMATDNALLDEADASGRAFLRLYRWSPPCLSFGRHEPAAIRYDRAAIERLGIDVVRRPTGGRAVWHEHEVTYAVAAPVAAFGSLRETYYAIHSRLAAALRCFGVEATLASGRPTARPPDRPTACFSAPVGGEVLIGDRKVIGSAQVRRGAAFLQHGSILLDGSQDLVTEVSRTPGAPPRATSLSAELGRTVTFQEVAAAIVATWGACVHPSASVPLASLRAGSSCFADPAWTWRR